MTYYLLPTLTPLYPSRIDCNQCCTIVTLCTFPLGFSTANCIKFLVLSENPQFLSVATKTPSIGIKVTENVPVFIFFATMGIFVLDLPFNRVSSDLESCATAQFVLSDSAQISCQSPLLFPFTSFLPPPLFNTVLVVT